MQADAHEQLEVMLLQQTLQGPEDNLQASALHESSLNGGQPGAVRRLTRVLCIIWSEFLMRTYALSPT